MYIYDIYVYGNETDDIGPIQTLTTSLAEMKEAF